MQRALVIIGIVLLLAGLAWPWLGKLPLGRLPGDLLIGRDGLRIYVPLTTMLLISIVVSILLWLFRK